VFGSLLIPTFLRVCDTFLCCSLGNDLYISIKNWLFLTYPKLTPCTSSLEHSSGPCWCDCDWWWLIPAWWIHSSWYVTGWAVLGVFPCIWYALDLWYSSNMKYLLLKIPLCPRKTLLTLQSILMRMAWGCLLFSRPSNLSWWEWLGDAFYSQGIYPYTYIFTSFISFLSLLP